MPSSGNPTTGGTFAISVAATARSSTARACKDASRWRARAVVDRRRQVVVSRRRASRAVVAAIDGDGERGGGSVRYRLASDGVELLLVGTSDKSRAARCSRARPARIRGPNARSRRSSISCCARCACAPPRRSARHRRYAAASRRASSRAICRSNRSTRTRRTCARSCGACARNSASCGARASSRSRPAAATTSRARSASRQIDGERRWLVGRIRRAAATAAPHCVDRDRRDGGSEDDQGNQAHVSSLRGRPWSGHSVHAFLTPTRSPISIVIDSVDADGVTDASSRRWSRHHARARASSQSPARGSARSADASSPAFA